MRVLWLLAVLGCKADVDTDGEPDCAPCADAGEVCVTNLDEAGAAAPIITCETAPADCGASLDCRDNTCLAQAYALCAPGYEGAFCAMDESPVVTCYAEQP
ncbi:MAG: hypothetical protein H6737_02810 [Alphaproteobacteria bacterium]|nr:hypothetical protein [Alphaproteobacteria bacterium]